MLHFDRWKIITILSVVLLGMLFAAPNLMSTGVRNAVSGYLPSKTINLGLDLRGGAHVLVEVLVEKVNQERLNNLKIDVRRALRNPDQGIRIQHSTKVEGDRLRVSIASPSDMPQALSLIRGVSNPVSSGPLGVGALGQELDVEQQGDNLIAVTLTDVAKQDMERNAVSQVIEIIRRRIDELGTREPTIQRQGTSRIIIQVPGAEDPQQVIDLIGQTAKLTFQMVESDNPAVIQEAMEGKTFRDAVLLPTENPNEPVILISSDISISGEMLVGASSGFDSQNREPIVNFRLNGVGASKFGRISTNNVGKRFAIVLDDRVISAPVIRGAITGGSGQISGSFTTETANDLAILLRAGALPAPVQVLEQRSVGAEMGADSIAAGKYAALIGFGAVIVFIILAYGRFGIYANIALIANLTLIFGVLSLLQATLTLPGIAGIVLTIGMAVDANVLIFERMREEVRAGKTPINAVEAGYAKALGTILDANITTFIAAAILFFIGSGPVKGFAVTLAIGILTSVFTAFTFTRLIVATWLKRARPSELPI